MVLLVVTDGHRDASKGRSRERHVDGVHTVNRRLLEINQPFGFFEYELGHADFVVELFGPFADVVGEQVVVFGATSGVSAVPSALRACGQTCKQRNQHRLQRRAGLGCVGAASKIASGVRPPVVEYLILGTAPSLECAVDEFVQAATVATTMCAVGYGTQRGYSDRSRNKLTIAF